jgi:hypothetical protein
MTGPQLDSVGALVEIDGKESSDFGNLFSPVVDEGNLDQTPQIALPFHPADMTANRFVAKLPLVTSAPNAAEDEPRLKAETETPITAVDISAMTPDQSWQAAPSPPKLLNEKKLELPVADTAGFSSPPPKRLMAHFQSMQLDGPALPETASVTVVSSRQPPIAAPLPAIAATELSAESAGRPKTSSLNTTQAPRVTVTEFSHDEHLLPKSASIGRAETMGVSSPTPTQPELPRTAIEPMQTALIFRTTEGENQTMLTPAPPKASVALEGPPGQFVESSPILEKMPEGIVPKGWVTPEPALESPAHAALAYRFAPFPAPIQNIASISDEALQVSVPKPSPELFDLHRATIRPEPKIAEQIAPGLIAQPQVPQFQEVRSGAGVLHCAPRFAVHTPRDNRDEVGTAPVVKAVVMHKAEEMHLDLAQANMHPSGESETKLRPAIAIQTAHLLPPGDVPWSTNPQTALPREDRLTSPVASTASLTSQQQHALTSHPVHQAVAAFGSGQIEGPTRIELVLTPEDLGSLRFEIQPKGDELLITLSAERPETRDLMRKHSADLLAELREAGFQGGTLSFGEWSDRQPDQSPGPPPPETETSPPTNTATVLKPPSAIKPAASGGLDLRF